MSMSYSDHFFGQDWAHYASQASKCAAITGTVIGLIVIFMDFEILAGLVSILAGTLLAIWEFPFAFAWLRNYEQIKFFLEETGRLKYEEGKGIMCIGFGLLSFYFRGWLLLTGIIFLITGVLYIFAAINRRSDDQLRAEAHPTGSSSTFPNALPLYHPIPSETTAFPTINTTTHQVNPPSSASFGTFQG